MDLTVKGDKRMEFIFIETGKNRGRKNRVKSEEMKTLVFVHVKFEMPVLSGAEMK